MLYNTYVCQGICPFHLMHWEKVVHNIPLLSFCISVDYVMMPPLLLLTLVICASLFFSGQFEKGLSVLLISKITFIDFPYYFHQHNIGEPIYTSLIYCHSLSLCTFNLCQFSKSVSSISPQYTCHLQVN